ncbi:MAG: hypothetical protein WDO16_16255 [Bacteroidota bacterium]
MHPLEGLPILDHYNSLLSNGKERHAWIILREFFESFDEETSKENLWYMLVRLLENDNEEIEARHRGNMIFFYQCCIALFKATNLLNQKKKGKITKKRKK